MALRRRALNLAGLLVFMGCTLSAPRAMAQIDAARFRVDLAEIAQYPSRVIGSPGYYAAGQYVAAEIAKLPGVQLKRHEFPVMVPVTFSATLESAGQQVDPIYPFWPAHVRVCATPPEGIHGKLVYVGQCTYAELKPASLFNQIAVIEASAGPRWREAFYDGARAELILGSADTSWWDLQDHDLRIPVNFPRFYIPPGKLADDLRAGRIPIATLKASVQWQRRLATNFYALVKPVKPVASAALMFSVPLDSTSLVPDLSPGASQAVQTAAGLALLRDIAKKRWRRPVVVFFSGADGIQFLGTRNMFMALGTPPANWTPEITSLDEQLAEARGELNRAREVQPSPGSLQITSDRKLIERILQIIDAQMADEQDQLFRLRGQPGAEAEVARLEEHGIHLNQVRSAMQDAPWRLNEPEYQADARQLIDQAITRLGGQANSPGLIEQYAARKAELTNRIDLYNWLAAGEGRPSAGDGRLIELLVGLDLTDQGRQAGPMFVGNFQRASSINQIQTYGGWFVNQAAKSDWWAHVRGVIDLEPLSQTRAAASYLAGPLPIASELAQAWGTPGMSMITLDDMRQRRDTPADTVDRIDLRMIVPQLAGVREMFFRAAADPKFKGPAQLKRLDAGFTGQVVGASPGKPVPDLPRPGFLATYYYLTSVGGSKQIPPLGIVPWTLGIRRGEVQDCDAEGNYRFEGLPRLQSDRLEGAINEQNDMQVLAVNVYRMNPRTGAITATTDLGRQAEFAKWSVDLKQDVPPLRSLAFDCQELSLTGLYDPRFLQTLGEVVPLDARRNAEPRHFDMWLHDKMLAGFIEPGSRIDLLIRYGGVGNRLILINQSAAPDGEGRGYTSEELNHLGPLDLATSRDFFQLDQQRLADYAKAGVSSPLVDQLHQAAAEELTSAQAALHGNDGVGVVRAATGAWANEARVYEAAQAMARDVVRGAIFLLILCVPFSFCLERLLIGTPNVYRQIGGVAAIFVAMTLILWTFHPAFRISASPLIVILAFAILSMSALVICVIYGKFDTELKRLRSGRGTAQGASFASAGVMMSAILLGIANMRKRRFRTLLTSVTIVLMTFAVLWFTSTSRYFGTATVSIGVPAAHPGIMLRQRGFRPMSPMLAEEVQAVLGDPALNIGRVQVVQRWWGVFAADPTEQYDLAGSKGAIGIQGVLGLSPGESRLSRIAEVIGPDKFARLENGESDIAYVSDGMAAQLHAREGDILRLGGMAVEIAGIFSAADFDQKVNMLSGDSLAPLQYSAGELDVGGQQMDETTSQSLELDGNAGGAEAASVYDHLSARDFVIVPAAICRRLPSSTLRCVAVRLQNQEQTRRVSEELSRRFALALYAGYDDGVRMVVASNLTSVSGVSQVAIPLLLAGMIIFNTMMGSIAQRRGEIHIYTSLGLAPMHVGALFLAEAMTYGLLGSVFGYIMGQGIGTALHNLGWLGSITLNYSGASAILTMSLILLIVLISALVPARLASKLAAPSIDRSWKVPTPKDDQITALLPFTINRTAADGALAYLAEYFESHREGSIGKFSVGPVETFPFQEPDSQATSRAIRTTIWLTPYDLGVRQHLMLLIHPGQYPDIYEVEVRLRRLSGDDGSWQRMNKTFLTELRKQFLQWRSLPAAKMLEYVQQSKQLFKAST